MLSARSMHVLVLVALEIAAVVASALEYPAARRSDLVENHHGAQVPDPYRWLEELDSAETRKFVLAHARLTDSYLAQIPARESIRQRLTKLLDYEKFGTPIRHGNRYFYTHNKGLQPHAVLYTTVGLEGTPKVAFDPNSVSTDGSVGVAGYAFSHDGSILAYGLAQGGGDWTDWHFVEVASGKKLPEVIRWTKYYEPVFAPDGKGVFYSGFPAPKAGEELLARDLGNTVYYHAFGTAQSADRKIYARPDHPDWQFQPHLTPGSNWLVLTSGEGQVGDKGLENIYVVDMTSSDAAVIPIVENFEAGYEYAGADRGLLYFQTSLAAPRGRVIAIDPKNSARKNWKSIIPQGPDAMDFAYGSVTLVHHQLIVRTLRDAHSRVAIYDLDGHLRREIELPGKGTASGFRGNPDDRVTFYTYTDLITPATIYRLDLESGASTRYRAPKIDFDLSGFESKQVFYPGKDGTRIPMYLVHKRGLKLDGQNPTLLYGYGGFGISILPRFDSTRLPWLERGGVFAIANIRGGGEYGEDWHKQAIRAHKQKGFDDFIAAAEWLIAERYTSKPRLAIEGGSNGGLLVGACLTQRPDLYGAVLANVGVFDMLRFHKFGQGAGWMGDFGSPENPDDFKTIYAYSPYHNVRQGTKYPATLVITGDHDTRVMPAHSFKFAAALQHAQAGPAPVLLRVQISAGHGGGSTTAQRIAEEADAYAFLIKNLGMD